MFLGEAMTNTASFARKLMRIRERQTQSSTPTAIFGKIGELPQALAAKQPYRVGLWPCISADKPEWAMGLWVLLAYTLERWRDVQVYRLFAKFEDEATTWNWSLVQSQFEIEAWSVEPLDENIAIWGEMTQADGHWQLVVSIENDLKTGEDGEPQEERLHFNADSPVAFVTYLPAIANQLITNIGAERLDETDVLFPVAGLPHEATLLPLLEKLLQWDIRLLASLWGIEWDDDTVLQDFEALLQAGKAVNHDIAAWAVTKSVAQTMLPGYSVVGDLLVDKVNDVIAAFPDSQFPAPIAAQALYGMGHVEEAFGLLEQHVENYPTNPAGWLKLAELYATSGRLQEAIECFQSAIDQQATSSYLYRAYGNVLLAADQYDEAVEEFALIDPDDVDTDSIIWEAIEAYEQALQADPGDLRALHAQLLQLLYVDAEETRFWKGFERLLQLDTTGEYVRDVVDSLYEFDDISPGIAAFEALLKQHPNRVDLMINLASLCLVSGDAESAQTHLDKAKMLATANDTLSEIERLLLMADDPEFEQHFGELAAVIDAGTALSAEDAEFLEAASENAPHLIEAHVMLARAYHVWGDSDAALEVLLDTQEKLPDNPVVLDLLAQILWEAGEKELAFEYLNKGILANPLYVPLLVHTGQYLFDNGQLAEARSYLSRADEIAPRDPILQTVRTYIARKMAERPDLYVEKD